MKLISETSALEKLQKLKSKFENDVRQKYEHNAKNCLTCEVQGLCCTDAHFVNVHITRLEAKAIDKALRELGTGKRARIIELAAKTTREFALDLGADNTYSCPLFEKGTGCLVHKTAKPIPCIQHACYEKKEDLPPESLQHEQEGLVQDLNERAYGDKWTWAAIPVWISNLKP